VRLRTCRREAPTLGAPVRALENLRVKLVAIFLLFAANTVWQRVLFKERGIKMYTANAKKFRSELKDYMDTAATEPIRINRRDGQSFILMSEQIYDDFRNEIRSLQRRLLAVTEIIDGKARPVNREEDRTFRFKK